MVIKAIADPLENIKCMLTEETSNELLEISKTILKTWKRHETLSIRHKIEEAIEFFTNSPQHKNVNIANFVLAVS